MDKNLKLQVAFAAIDKLTGPMRNMAAGSGTLAKNVLSAKSAVSALNKEQQKINSRKELSAGLTANIIQLGETQRKISALKTEIAQTSGPTVKLSRELRAAEASEKRLTIATGQHVEKLKKSNAALIASGVDVTDLAQHEAQLAKKISIANASLETQAARLSKVQKLQDRAGKIRNAAGGAGAAASLAITAPGLLFARESIAAALEARDAIGQVQASLTSAGRAGEFTAAQLKAMASGEMRKSLYDDDQILRDVTATMLGYGKIQGPVFGEAQQLAVDYAAKFKTDLGPAAKLVGKALNDPVKGMKLLAKSGVSFSTEQQSVIKRMVETGNVAGAQAILMGKLNKVVGGGAEAARKADPAAAARQSYADLQETVGEQLIPIMNRLMGLLGGMAERFNNLSPSMQNAIIYAGIFAVAIGPILIGIGALAAGVGMMAGPVVAFASGISKMVTVMRSLHMMGTIVNLFKILRTAAMFMARGVMQAGLMMLANPMILAIVAIVAALGLAAYLIYANWDKIKAAFYAGVAAMMQAWSSIKAAFYNGIAVIKAAFYVGVAAIMQAWSSIKAAFYNGIAVITEAWESVKAGFASALEWLAGLGGQMLTIGGNIISGLANGIIAAGGAVWNALKSVVEKGIARIKDFLGIKSPSRLFMGMGGYMAQGMELGITKGGKNTIKAAARLAAGAAAAGAITLSPLNAAQIGGNAGPRGPSAQISAGGAAAAPAGGGVTINVYGAAGQDMNQLAAIIMEKIQRAQGVQQRSAFDDGQ